MTTLTLKANSRGSWANVCDFPEEELPYVQEGAVGIVKASRGTVAFKITDGRNSTLYSLDARVSTHWQDRRLH